MVSLSLAIARLNTAPDENFAVWSLQAPFPGGYVHHDRIWPVPLSQKWLAWQEMFSLQDELLIPVNHPHLELTQNTTPNGAGYSSRLMQELGISLWQWLFQSTLQDSLAQSRGIAQGQNKPLRLRLDLRDPNLIALPWEIMQPEAGKQAISLNQQLFFSRTTSDVDPLSYTPARDSLEILLVMGQNTQEKGQKFTSIHPQKPLQLQEEAALLSQIFTKQAGEIKLASASVPARVDVLLQPHPKALIAALETRRYNVFFYAGHGLPAPDGGLLFLSNGVTLNGTELAQVLVRNQVTLAVFNACWGALPARAKNTTIPRSSLAEVLIHHGVPAVLGMRDEIADREALTFIQTLTEALSERMPIDRAVAIARQHLLTLYKFNQPAWTLPILYMHPQFNGEIVRPLGEGITELPTILPEEGRTALPLAKIHQGDRVWVVKGGLMRVGRRPDNDLVLSDRWVSQTHAEIFCREISNGGHSEPTYFIRDFSRYGTLVSNAQGWQKIHHQEVQLASGSQLKFGSSQGESLKFIIEPSF